MRKKELLRNEVHESRRHHRAKYHGRQRPGGAEKRITHRYHGMDPIPEAMDLFLHYDRSLIKPVIYND